MPINIDPAFVVIPREFSPDWKVEIIRTDGTIDDVTNDLLYAKFNHIVTEAISDFEVKIDDGKETYADRYSGTEIVRIYFDNGITASTKRFEGKVEKIKKIYQNGFYQIQLIGMHISKELKEVLVSKTYTNTVASSILTNLISTYLTGYTTANVTATTTAINVSWTDKPLLDCVRDLCEISNFDFYVDDSKDFHFLERNTVLNEEEIVWSGEVLETQGLGDVTFDIKNRVRVYGQDDIGMPIIYTADDTASQTIYGVIEAPPISDSSINTYDEAKKRAEGELLLMKAKKFQGQVTVLGFPTVLAGQTIWVSLPEQMIHGQYRVMQVSHEIGMEIEEGFRSIMNIEKPVKDLMIVLRDSQRSIEGKDTSKSQNPNGLRFSYNFPFNDTSNIASLNSVEVSEGKLILSSGQSSGTMETNSHSASANITKVELRYEGSNLDQSTFQVSNNNGINWETVTRNVLLTLVNIGNLLRIKVTLNLNGDTRPEIDSLCILYS